MFLLMDKLLEDGGSKTLENENFALSLEKKTVTDLVKSDRNPVNGVNFALGGIAESVLGDESVKLYVSVKLLYQHLAIYLCFFLLFYFFVCLFVCSFYIYVTMSDKWF